MNVPFRERDSHRKIIGLRRAALLPGRPNHLGKDPRLRGSRAAGVTFERHVGRRLRKEEDIISGQWFDFTDENGVGCCQTDHYILREDHIILFECKLTETWVGFSQIDFLYRPVLEHIYSLPVTGVQVCKHLTTRHNPRLIGDWREAAIGRNYVWHYLP
jgi:hypothetical protein